MRSTRTPSCRCASYGRSGSRGTGRVESPEKWHVPFFDEDAVGDGFATSDALLMGRVLYNEWAAYWPEHAAEPFGDVMNSIKK
jgi:hypothetical protein